MGFLFGVGVAAHQVEGNNVNSDWWAFEHTAAHPAEPSGDAIDQYHRYADDIRLVRELGFNTFRFSVEWARLEPEPGHFSAAAFAHYRRMLATCIAEGLTPIVTVHHFSSPRWIAASGGWRADSTPLAFGRYCQRVAAELGDLIPIACTLNEINMPELIAIDGGLSDFTERADAAAPFPFCESEAASRNT
jgi:beta-glucosidase